MIDRGFFLSRIVCCQFLKMTQWLMPFSNSNGISRACTAGYIWIWWKYSGYHCEVLLRFDSIYFFIKLLSNQTTINFVNRPFNGAEGEAATSVLVCWFSYLSYLLTFNFVHSIMILYSWKWSCFFFFFSRAVCWLIDNKVWATRIKWLTGTASLVDAAHALLFCLDFSESGEPCLDWHFIYPHWIVFADWPETWCMKFWPPLWWRGKLFVLLTGWKLALH